MELEVGIVEVVVVVVRRRRKSGEVLREGRRGMVVNYSRWKPFFDKGRKYLQFTY